MKRFKLIIITTCLGLLASACGGQPVRESINANQGGTGATNNGGTNNGGGSTEEETDPNLLPPITSAFSLTGQGGTTPTFSMTVSTDDLLKVKITPGAAGQISVPGYSNFSSTYNCVSFRVKILGQTVDTGTMQVNGGNSLCANAPTSKTLNLSNRLTAGHGDITIDVEASGYDFYCQSCLTMPWLYGAYPYGNSSCSLYCPSHTVYRTHTVTGTVSVQVNGTTAP